MAPRRARLCGTPRDQLTATSQPITISDRAALVKMVPAESGVTYRLFTRLSVSQVPLPNRFPRCAEKADYPVSPPQVTIAAAVVVSPRLRVRALCERVDGRRYGRYLLRLCLRQPFSWSFVGAAYLRQSVRERM